MPFQTRLNLSTLDRAAQFALINELTALRAELDDMRAKYAALQTALNAGTAVGAAGYPNASMALVAKQFSAV